MSFAIGKLSLQTGCHIETIRYYERIGLIPPAVRRGRYRHYATPDVERLRFIRRARDLGFALDEIRALLGLDAAATTSCIKAHAIAEANLFIVRSKLTDLHRMEAVLEKAITACAPDAFSGCPILSALSGLSPQV